MDDVWKKHLEMSMAISYQEEDPFQGYRGIFRSLLYEGTTHANLAIKLFSFAAQVTQQLNNSKLYVVSDPLEPMLESLGRALPKGSYHSFENPWIRQDKKSTDIMIKNQDGEVVFEINQQNSKKYPWLLKYINEKIFFITELSTLANLDLSKK